MPASQLHRSAEIFISILEEWREKLFSARSSELIIRMFKHLVILCERCNERLRASHLSCFYLLAVKIFIKPNYTSLHFINSPCGSRLVKTMSSWKVLELVLAFDEIKNSSLARSRTLNWRIRLYRMSLSQASRITNFASSSTFTPAYQFPSRVKKFPPQGGELLELVRAFCFAASR